LVERIDILSLEGLSINGFVEDAELVDCERKGNMRYAKIRAKLSDGRIVETQCDVYPRIVRVYLTLVKYKKWGKLIPLREVTEEMMSGITYDLDLGKKE